MEKALSGQHSAISQNQDQKQKPFTTEDTHSTPFGRSGQAPGTEKSKIATKQRAEALVRRIGEACDELERLAEENPELVGLVTSGSEEHKDAYLRLKARLELADATPRCRWVRQDGTGCGSPQMKKHIYCFAPADDGGASPGAKFAGAGGRERDPGGADADTEGAD